MPDARTHLVLASVEDQARFDNEPGAHRLYFRTLDALGGRDAGRLSVTYHASRGRARGWIAAWDDMRPDGYGDGTTGPHRTVSLALTALLKMLLDGRAARAREEGHDG